jgi:hypothetical protein
MGPADRQSLRHLCEAFRGALRDRVPLTRFRLEMTPPGGGSETVLLVDPEPIPRPDDGGRMPIRPLQPRVAVSVSIGGEGGMIGVVTIEHASRELEANELRHEIERVAERYAPALRAWAEDDATWTAQR